MMTVYVMIAKAPTRPPREDRNSLVIYSFSVFLSYYCRTKDAWLNIELTVEYGENDDLEG